MTWNPNEEGITHINAYSKSRTTLGKMLSNFHYSPIYIPGDGRFNSIEGYWYWLLSEGNPEREKLRKLAGYYAKQVGRELVTQDYPAEDNQEFKSKICEALAIKIRVNTELRERFQTNTLPIVHYYTYGDKIVVPKHGQWVWDYLNHLRTTLQHP